MQADPEGALRALADLAGLTRQATPERRAALVAILGRCRGGRDLAAIIRPVAPWPLDLGDGPAEVLALAAPARWRHRLGMLRTPAAISVFLRLGW